jgi:hypothetical protein
MSGQKKSAKAGMFEKIRHASMQRSQMEIQFWPIDRLVFYARNPRKNEAAVERGRPGRS